MREIAPFYDKNILYYITLQMCIIITNFKVIKFKIIYNFIFQYHKKKILKYFIEGQEIDCRRYNFWQFRKDKWGDTPNIKKI